MCMGCWREHGSPGVADLPEDGEKLTEVAREIDPFGAFHIVVEDFNVEDHHIQSCLDMPRGMENLVDPDDLARLTPSEEEKVWGRRMLELTVRQRAAVLGRMERFF